MEGDRDTHKQREKIEAGERKRARQKQRKAQTGLQNGRYSETRHTDRSMIVARQTDRHNHETSRQKKNDYDKTDEDTITRQAGRRRMIMTRQTKTQREKETHIPTETKTETDGQTDVNGRTD